MPKPHSVKKFGNIWRVVDANGKIVSTSGKFSSREKALQQAVALNINT